MVVHCRLDSDGVDLAIIRDGTPIGMTTNKNDAVILVRFLNMCRSFSKNIFGVIDFS